MVLDASAVVALLRRAEPEVPALEALVRVSAAQLHAPELLDLEVTNALRRLLRRGEASTARAGQAVTDLGDLPIQRWPHRPLLGRIWDLRQALTAYDGAYLALAELLDATLVTLDDGLARVAARTVEVAALR